MEKSISIYQVARKQRHNLYLKYETVQRRPDVLYSKYKDTKRELKDAKKRIQIFEEMMDEKDKMLQEKEEKEKDCKPAQIYPTQGKCGNK